MQYCAHNEVRAAGCDERRERNDDDMRHDERKRDDGRLELAGAVIVEQLRDERREEVLLERALEDLVKRRRTAVTRARICPL